ERSAPKTVESAAQVYSLPSPRRLRHDPERRDLRPGVEPGALDDEPPLGLRERPRERKLEPELAARLLSRQAREQGDRQAARRESRLDRIPRERRGTGETARAQGDVEP